MRFIRSKTVSDPATCAEVMRHLQAYIDGELPDEIAARRIATHLESCRRCGLEAETYNRLKRSLERLRPIDEKAIRRLEEFARRLGDQPTDDESQLG